jgi:tetratricopeptide (TPR) repeat protein
MESEDFIDVEILETQSLNNAEGLKAVGNTHFAKEQYKKAARCYSLALQHCADDGVLSVLLNASMASRNIGDDEGSLRFAVAALALTATGHAKANFRVAEAFERLRCM